MLDMEPYHLLHNAMIIEGLKVQQAVFVKH